MFTEHYLRAGIAAQALAGILTAPNSPDDFKRCVQIAVDYSDALIAEVEKRHSIELVPPPQNLDPEPTTGDLDRH